MNAISFRDLGLVEGLFEPSEAAIAAADPFSCGQRGAPRTNRNGLVSAPCALLSREAGRSVGVDEAICRICICHGPANSRENAALKRHICQLAFSGTVAGRDQTEPKTPGDAELETALENIRRWRGDEAARRFVDTLVYHESVTPEKGAELVTLFTLPEAPS